MIESILMMSLRCHFSKTADKGDGGDIHSIFVCHFFHFDIILSFTEKNLPDGLNDFRDVDALGTADVAGHTGSAAPN